MTRFHRARGRRAFTLLELLVVMALIAGLAAMAMVITPGVLDRDRSVAAVSQLESAFQLSRARAQRDGLPRGVRLILNPGSIEATEYQYVEYTPIWVPNTGGAAGNSPYVDPPQQTNGNPQPPYVQFIYTVQAAPGTQQVPAGSVTNRQCQIVGLTPEHQAQLLGQFNGGQQPLISLPLLGTWFTMTRVVSVTATTVTVDLANWPDAQLGATTRWRTYHFGLYGQPRVLLGEPTLQLPQKTCVDLALSDPPGNVGTDYDIMFAPSGQLIGGTGSSTRGAGHVFLWVRDPGRPRPTPGNGTVAGSGFEPAGEQLVTVIKARSGAVGSGPVDWGIDPFFLAKKAISGQ